MGKQLFPKEFIRSSLEHYTFRIRQKSSAIYIALLLSIGLMFSLLPFISLDVTVSSIGLIGTDEQRHLLSSPLGGRILDHDIFENRWVNKGDTLLRLDASSLIEESNANKSRLLVIEGFIADLELLIADPSTLHTEMAPSKYRLAKLQYHSLMSKLVMDNENANRTYSRQKNYLKVK